MKTYLVSAKVISENSYPKSIWLKFHVEAAERDEVIGKAYKFIDNCIPKCVEIEVKIEKEL